MGLFDRKPKVIEVDIPTERNAEIQASEGIPRKMQIDSLLQGRLTVAEVPGTYNGYETYEDQVAATYKKYNGGEDFGNQQVRAVVDIRTAFIASEGISISCKDEGAAEWIENFLRDNKLQGSGFFNAVKATEMSGHTLLALDVKSNKDDEQKVRVRRFKYKESQPFKPVYLDDEFTDELNSIKVKKNGAWVALDVKNIVYVRTGGDDSSPERPTTKVGVVLTDIDNYDRALKDIRRNNFIFARVTPTFEVSTESEAKALKKWLQQIQWKIGTAFIGRAKFDYKSPDTSAYENLSSEMTMTLKTITGTTGVPVHWLGHVDLMSNRATATALYESIKNATSYERVIWEEAVYDLILKAQEMYIDQGGSLKLFKDFEVKIPLIDFEGFKDTVSALSMAYSDEAISIDDYRNMLPGIDPMKTAKAVKAEREESEKRLVKMGVTHPENIPEEEGEEDDESEQDGESDE